MCAGISAYPARPATRFSIVVALTDRSCRTVRSCDPINTIDAPTSPILYGMLVHNCATRYEQGVLSKCVTNSRASRSRRLESGAIPEQYQILRTLQLRCQILDLGCTLVRKRAGPLHWTGLLS